MRLIREASEPKPFGKADSAGSNSNGKHSPNPYNAGFLLIDTALRPLYMNARAAEILFYPEKPSKTKDFAARLASKIRTIVAQGGSDGRTFVTKDFFSGGRHYVCRFFDVQKPRPNSNGANGSSLALLFERGPEASTVDVLKICAQCHLTRREAEVVRLLVQGLASKEIAARMEISPNTVKVFLRFAMMKMGVSSRSGILSKFINADTYPGTSSFSLQAHTPPSPVRLTERGNGRAGRARIVEKP